MQVILSLMVTNGLALEIHGHRGARAVYPENTLVAINYAFEIGSDFVEIDTQMTKDGVVIVHHDPSINPSICQYKNGKQIKKELVISQMTFEDVKTVDCGSKPLREFPKQQKVAGEEIPSLQEVIDVFKIHQARRPEAKLNIEIKYSNDRRYPPIDQYVANVVDLIYLNKIDDAVIIQSFSKEVISLVKTFDPKLTAYFLFKSPFVNYLKIVRETGCDGVSVHHKLLSARMVQTIKNFNLKILTWTLNKPSEWLKAINLGIDGIITDDPESLMTYLGEGAAFARPSTNVQ